MITSVKYIQNLSPEILLELLPVFPQKSRQHIFPIVFVAETSE